MSSSNHTSCCERRSSVATLHACLPCIKPQLLHRLLAQSANLSAFSGGFFFPSSMSSPNASLNVRFLNSSEYFIGGDGFACAMGNNNSNHENCKVLSLQQNKICNVSSAIEYHRDYSLKANMPSQININTRQYKRVLDMPCQTNINTHSKANANANFN